MTDRFYSIIQLLIFLYFLLIYIHRCTQKCLPIRGSVLPLHRTSVIRTPTVLRLHLTCAPRHGPGVTGVNAIKDTPEMASVA